MAPIIIVSFADLCPDIISAYPRSHFSASVCAWLVVASIISFIFLSVWQALFLKLALLICGRERQSWCWSYSLRQSMTLFFFFSSTAFWVSLMSDISVCTVLLFLKVEGRQKCPYRRPPLININIVMRRPSGTFWQNPLSTWCGKNNSICSEAPSDDHIFVVAIEASLLDSSNSRGSRTIAVLNQFRWCISSSISCFCYDWCLWVVIVVTEMPFPTPRCLFVQWQLTLSSTLLFHVTKDCSIAIVRLLSSFSLCNNRKLTHHRKLFPFYNQHYSHWLVQMHTSRDAHWR